MATENIEIAKGDWVDIITEGSLTLTDSQYYTINVYANGESQIAIADTKPSDGFIGHPTTARINFGFTYKTGDVIWVKLNELAADTAIVVLT
ncbi:MAG: hypothetical protein II453_10190 [Alphaproteobacteria bacterium]|nr:hypothetical protein [Alphaproteobacteria bacterium]MBQ3946378.1 hypothetical protein [Alphaproteobacteria bacterium]